MKPLTAVAICLVAVLSVAVLAAHENFRIIGAVTTVTLQSLDVKQTKDGKVVSMRMNRRTPVVRDNKPVDRAELKVGANVVVDARGDSLQDLVVQTVRLVPGATTKK